MTTPADIKVLLYSLLLQHATSNELRDFCFRLDPSCLSMGYIGAHWEIEEFTCKQMP